MIGNKGIDQLEWAKGRIEDQDPGSVCLDVSFVDGVADGAFLPLRGLAYFVTAKFHARDAANQSPPLYVLIIAQLRLSARSSGAGVAPLCIRLLRLFCRQAASSVDWHDWSKKNSSPAIKILNENRRNQHCVDLQ